MDGAVELSSENILRWGEDGDMTSNILAALAPKGQTHC